MDPTVRWHAALPVTVPLLWQGFWDASAGNFGEGSGEVSSPDGEREVEFRYAGPAFSHWYHTFYRVSCERERRS